MALIDTMYPVEHIHGKMAKTQKVVFTERYGNTHGWLMEDPLQPNSVTQVANRTKFANTVALVKSEMADPIKKAEWQKVADTSNGKWKTARGAAFAAMYANAE